MPATQPLILLVGATGTVGSLVARKLVAGGARVRALARDVHAATARLGRDVEVVHGHLLDGSSLVSALRGVEVASLATVSGPQLVEQEGTFVAAAERAKLPRLVKLSARAADLVADVPIFGWHAESERRIRESGIAATVLRPVVFMSNLLWEVPAVKTGVLHSIMGDGRMSFVDPEDVADLTVAALTDAAHAGRTWDFGGADALTYDDVAATFTRVLGRLVEHVRLDEATFRTMMASSGVPDWLVEGIAVTASLTREGRFAVGDQVIESVLGRRARNLADWMEKNRTAFEVAS